MSNDELTLAVLRRIEEEDTQKSLAQKLGISVGKANYVLKALIDKGFIKAERFIHFKNKRGYAYLLTPEGIRAKIELTEQYIRIKKREYEELQRELEQSRRSMDEIKRTERQ